MAQRTRSASRVGTSDEQPISTRIALELAEQADAAVDEIAPLARSIDPEALNRLFDGAASGSGHVIFCHEGYQITVSSSGDVTVEPLGVE